MIGYIISGHGNIASGMLSAINLILGPQDDITIVDFPSGDTATELELHAKQAIASLSHCEHIIVFTDLLSGSPFNVFSMKAILHQHMDVIYGMNLGMMIESIMKRNMEGTLEDIISSAIETGKNQIGLFTMINSEDDDF